MLTSLVLSLTTEHARTLPLHLGRAGHALFLRLIAASDPALAEALHAPNQPRPFTCSTLWGARRQAGALCLEPGPTYFMRFTGLSGPVSAHLQAWVVAPPATVELDNVALTVSQATLDPQMHPWAGQSSYESLSAPYLLARAQPKPQVELEFAAPTAFRSAGRTVPLPLPELVFGGLATRWNEFAPVAIAEEVRRFAGECLAISRYRLKTVMLQAKGQSMQIGFVGRCAYTALNRDRYWLGLIQMLADYAFYAGVGYQTSVGLGQARRAVARETHR
jgi:CRISPR-associated endoribonuclease Cas6